MEKRMIHGNQTIVAILTGNENEIIISDAQSALDLLATLDYYDNCQAIAINKEAIVEDFFRLGSGIAGEILQKFSNYRKKLAIIGDFSAYTSKPLKDFMYECNNGKSIFFVPDEETAILKLTTA